MIDAIELLIKDLPLDAQARVRRKAIDSEMELASIEGRMDECRRIGDSAPGSFDFDSFGPRTEAEDAVRELQELKRELGTNPALILYYALAQEFLSRDPPPAREQFEFQLNQIAKVVKEKYPLTLSSVIEGAKQAWMREFWTRVGNSASSEKARSHTKKMAQPNVERFPRRATRVKEWMKERGMSKIDVEGHGGPDRKTMAKILRGEAVREDVLEKLAQALSKSKKFREVTILDIPTD